MKLHEQVEGKGYFVGYKCKNCNKSEAEHKKDGKNCIVDARKTIHNYHSNKFFTANEKKPVFVKILL